MAIKPRWTYELVSERKRHPRGYYADFCSVVRDDGKVIATVKDPEQAASIKRKFQGWARQPWR